MTLVFEAADLGPQEKSILLAIANHTDPGGKTFAGEARLMREAGMTRTTFQRWRAHLVQRDLIVSRRRGRHGGGRATSDTYLNLAALRSMRDPFFGATATDRPDDENPFMQVEGNGPTGEAIDAGGASNGPAGGASNGPAGGADPALPVGPVTLINPQSKSSGGDSTTHTPHGRNVEGSDRVCVVDEQILEDTAARVLDSVAIEAKRLLSEEDQASVRGVVQQCLAKGHSSAMVVRRVAGKTTSSTHSPEVVLLRALRKLLKEPPAVSHASGAPGVTGSSEAVSAPCASCKRRVSQLGGEGVCAECMAEGLHLYLVKG